MDADAYLSSLGIEVKDPSQRTIGRLSLAGEFLLDGARGVLLKPKRGDVSDRYLELLAGAGYQFVVADGSSFPSFYAREGASLSPIRALPVRAPSHFPTGEVLTAWTQLVRASAGSGDAARLGVAQLVARIDEPDVFGPEIISSTSDVPVARLGGSKAAAPEPLRTAAALLAAYRLQPTSPQELARLFAALSSLLPDKGQFSGLAEALVPLLQAHQLGRQRLLVSGGIGAEVSALLGVEGTVVLPAEVRVMEPVLERLLPDAERVFADFLQTQLKPSYDGVVLVPPLGHKLGGQQIAKFELAKRGDKVRARVATELLFVEHALATTTQGGVLIMVLPEGLLSSAGHADFREWLLERARLLAVLSLPVGACFRGSNVKCSVVLMQKLATSDDYPILMVDLEADDVGGDVAAAKSRLDAFLEREVAACA